MASTLVKADEHDEDEHDRQLDGPSRRAVEVLGRSARYHVAGEGLPVVFLHGWGLGHRSYRHSLSRLVDLGCRVWAPSLPGFGGSAPLAGDATQDGITLNSYADWVAAFLDAVGIDEPVFLVGHSFGGGVAIATAHRHGHRVRSLVLVNSIGGATWKDAADGALESVRTMAERPLWDWGRHFSRDLFPLRLGRRVIPAVIEDAVRNVLRSPQWLWKAGHLARSADLTAELTDLRRRQLPIVALWGTRDAVIPKPSFDALCAAIGSDGETVEGSHSWLLADPDAFGAVMTNAVQVATAARAAEQAPPPAPVRWVHRLRGRLRRRTSRATEI